MRWNGVGVEERVVEVHKCVFVGGEVEGGAAYSWYSFATPVYRTKGCLFHHLVGRACLSFFFDLLFVFVLLVSVLTCFGRCLDSEILAEVVAR
mmetsp:Transcript_16856/g.68860  ORF Transcript_16856/g.68860 Transcript_16856/m.68860 type:complete len:93 (-) Transcript_16856:546-824(-)